MQTLTSDSLLKELRKFASPKKAAALPGFFQCFPGGYGEGDQFLGLTVPDQRKCAHAFRDMPLEQLSLSLRSVWHESRLTALFILVNRFKKSKSEQRIELCDFYLEHLDDVDNWDLVDSSAKFILGECLCEKQKDRHTLFELANSGKLWRERVAVVATQALIKKREFSEIVQLSVQFLDHPHDLIHKAVGWTLREMGKVEEKPLIDFLKRYSKKMPRTMLRYSIEKFPIEVRQKFMER